jgi:xanthine dehydrogenase YagT iron-sulfur-binding subunit
MAERAGGLTRRALMAGGAGSGVVVARRGQAEDGVRQPAGGEVEKIDITLTVNGQRRPLKLDPRTTVLDALREHLSLTGTKKGCDHGQCGACTVLVNGRRINACLTLAVMHEDDDIITIEGLGVPGKRHAGGLPAS